MGAYLSQPNLEKVSEDGGNGVLRFGASAMQGWRLAQEDAHNCLPNLDEDTAFFGVYDGHGGPEVAIYTSKHLPDVIKNSKAYKSGDLGKALEDSFMEFDAKLKEESVIEELKEIAGVDNASDTEEDVKSEIEGLNEEANLSLGELLLRYGVPKGKNQRHIRKHANKTDLLSPVVTNKRTVFPDSDEEEEDQVNGNKESQVSEKKQLFTGKEEEGNIEEGENNEESTDKLKSSNGHNDTTENNVNNSNVNTTSDHSTTKTDEVHCNGSSDKEEKSEKSSQGSEGSKGKSKVEEENNVGEDDDEDYVEPDEEDEEEDGEDEDEFENGEEEEEELEEDVPQQDHSDEPGSDSGTTACCLLLRGKEIVVGNVGDSRCVLSRSGEAVDLSIDHKPEDDKELQRIEHAGGKVTLDGRVNGGLNLSRALGDHGYKTNEALPPEEQMISAFPDLQTATLKDEDEFLVIACDGIWNAMTSQEVVDFIHERLEAEESVKLSSVCEDLFDLCLAPDTSGDGTGCDNMTCIIIQFPGNGDSGSAKPGHKRKAQSKSSGSKRPKN